MRQRTLRIGTAEILRRDVIDQPDAVAGAVKCEAIPRHPLGIDREDHRTPMSRPNARRRLDIRREVDMVAAHFEQAIPFDRRNVLLRRAVIQDRRRLSRLKLKIDGRAVALLRPNLRAGGFERKALLVVLRHNFFKLVPADRKLMAGARGE